jgi:hypothetical protein
MTIRTLLFTSSLAAVGCSSPLVSGTDAAGGAGGGGVGGAGPGGVDASGGASGTTGAIDAGPGLCANPSANVGAFTLGDDGRKPLMSFNLPVAVVSVDDCTTGACAPTTSSGARVVLSDVTGRRWTVFAYFLGLPASFVSVGETLELGVVYRNTPTPFYRYDYFTTVLSRAGAPVVFDAAAATDLAPYGIKATSLNGIYCFDGCFTDYGASVTYGSDTRNVAPMETAQIGKLSFTHRGFRIATNGCGDSPTQDESMAGFVAP